eukprot:scaffold4174_cov92-Skeletonema_marinoi.AAC.1
MYDRQHGRREKLEVPGDIELPCGMQSMCNTSCKSGQSDNGIFRATESNTILKEVKPYLAMTTSSSTDALDALCPYTLKPISSIDKSELAVINPEESECGHKCSLPHLVSYIHDASAGSTHFCPVCLQSKVTVVCDGNAADKVLRGGHGENDEQEQEVVCL